MAVWLKIGLKEVAFENDIVPRESMCVLTDLEHLAATAQDDAQALRTEAERHAAECVEKAEADAVARAAKAEADAAAVTRLGYAQGRRDGLRHWHAQASAQRQAAGKVYRGSRERLADMVVQATASLLQGEMLESYLSAALSVLDHLAEKDMTLSVKVHPDDRAAASLAIDRLRSAWRDGTVVKLIDMPRLARGSCICESPQGYVDGSLSLQLATLRHAALGALEGLRLPDDMVDAPAAGPSADLPGQADRADRADRLDQQAPHRLGEPRPTDAMAPYLAEAGGAFAPEDLYGAGGLGFPPASYGTASGGDHDPLGGAYEDEDAERSYDDGDDDDGDPLDGDDKALSPTAARGSPW